MAECVFGADVAQFFPCFAAEGAAGRGKDEGADFLGRAACHALKQGVMLRVHGQKHSSGAGADRSDQRPGKNKAFLIGKADDLARLGGGHSGSQARRANLCGEHNIHIFPGGNGGESGLSGENFGVIPGRKHFFQGLDTVFAFRIAQGKYRRTPTFRLTGQQGEIAPSSQSRYDEFAGLFSWCGLGLCPPCFNYPQGIDANGTRTAHERHTARPGQGRVKRQSADVTHMVSGEGRMWN